MTARRNKKMDETLKMPMRQFLGEPSQGFDRHYVEMPRPITPHQLADCDPGIRMYVDILSWHGIETNQSCEGGPGHAYHEPTIDFTGTPEQVWRAVAIAETFRLPVSEVGIRWFVDRGMPQHPIGYMTFRAKAGADYVSPCHTASP